MRYIALLRGINLGGNKMIKMEALRTTFERLGFESVSTYINSGNIAFNADIADEVKLCGQIEDAIANDFQMTVPVMVRKQAYVKSILKNNPFDGQYESHKHMHVLFLKEPMPAEKEVLLQASAFPGERYEVRDREIYNLLPNGVAGSLLSKGFFEKKPRVSYTGRNWRTVEKLAEL